MSDGIESMAAGFTRRLMGGVERRFDSFGGIIAIGNLLNIRGCLGDRGGSALQRRQFVELGRCARCAVACVGGAAARIEENPLALLEGDAVGARPASLGAGPVGIALVARVRDRKRTRLNSSH